ncbi:MAG: hypothetical protein HC833_02365 [Leptolyngbyaceae cyanobacterium RM1_406_9]|nr:hypothetical protein [Leptolyngbyaceae cyanobacterium RM1_406_9]
MRVKDSFTKLKGLSMQLRGSSAKVSDSFDELRAFILQLLHEQQQPVSNESTRSLEDVFASIDCHMWTPPTEAKSLMELVREDRDR